MGDGRDDEIEAFREWRVMVNLEDFDEATKTFFNLCDTIIYLEGVDDEQVYLKKVTEQAEIFIAEFDKQFESRLSLCDTEEDSVFFIQSTLTFLLHSLIKRCRHLDAKDMKKVADHIYSRIMAAPDDDSSS